MLGVEQRRAVGHAFGARLALEGLVRLAMRVDPWWRPLLAVFGVRSQRAYVAVDERDVTVCLGFFRHRFPRAHVVGAELVQAHWLVRLGAGIGWHTNFSEGLIVNGSLGGLVELRLAPPERLRLLLIPLRCTRLWVSMVDPDALIRALGPLPAGGAPRPPGGSTTTAK